MDVVVTIAQSVWLNWLAEGDLPGEDSTGEWALYYGSGRGKRSPSPPKNLHPGDRVYIIAWGLLRGYSTLLRIEPTTYGYALVRGGGAVACARLDGDKLAGTMAPMPSFQGPRYRWWEREEEAPFLDWQTSGLPMPLARDVTRLGVLRELPHARTILRERALSGAPLFPGLL